MGIVIVLKIRKLGQRGYLGKLIQFVSDGASVLTQAMWLPGPRLSS